MFKWREKKRFTCAALWKNNTSQEAEWNLWHVAIRAGCASAALFQGGSLDVGVMTPYLSALRWGEQNWLLSFVGRTTELEAGVERGHFVWTGPAPSAPLREQSSFSFLLLTFTMIVVVFSDYRLMTNIYIQNCLSTLQLLRVNYFLVRNRGIALSAGMQVSFCKKISSPGVSGAQNAMQSSIINKIFSTCGCVQNKLITAACEAT